jgi:hypothetical protein
MASVTTLPTFLEKLRDELESQTALSGVSVYTAAVDEVTMGERSIVLAAAPVEVAYEYQTMPRTQAYETYDVTGIIWVSALGGGETAICDARDAAFAILEGVHDYVAGLVGKAETTAALGVDHVKVTGYRMEQAISDASRHVVLTFTVSADAYFTPA